jgi:predicted ABC-type ATPase
MNRSSAASPLCVIIAGPNGAGETTFARQFLPKDVGVVNFVNADLIAAGLSPLRPESALVVAGRLLLKEIDRLAAARENFAFETTLSGLTYAARIKRWRGAGYRVELAFLQLSSANLACRRVASRTRAGGHDVPEADVRRRFDRGRRNLDAVYRPLVDAWALWDNSGASPVLLETGP